MPSQTFTAPQAHVVIDGQVAGFVRNLTWTENIQRNEVRGLGSLYAQEAPAVSASNSFNVDMFFIDFKRPVVKKLLNRTGGAQALMNTLSLGDIPMSISVYRKTVKTMDSNTKLITEIDKTGEEIVVIRDALVNAQNWGLAEQGIASLGTSGIYLTPTCQNE
jgi:hypothetical protein